MLICWFLPSVYADIIVVGGSMAESQVWTPDNTYVVVQDLRIGPGITLEIKPGVHVLIDQGRGIHLWGGNLVVGDMLGMNTDTVYFSGNYKATREDWKWKGIKIQEAGEENIVLINYACVEDAEKGIELIDCFNVEIMHSSVSRNQIVGVSMTDCSNCIVESCRIEQNFNGMEMITTPQKRSRENVVFNNLFLNSNHNIYLRNQDNGQFTYNYIYGNIIEGANNGIWMDNTDNGQTNHNQILNNVFLKNGSGFGYGILLAMDSTVIQNNIFWANNIALSYDPFGDNAQVSGNSFYQNVRGVQIGGRATGNFIFQNTLSRQSIACFETKETDNIQFRDNNLFPDGFDHPIAYNNTPNDLLITQNWWGSSDVEVIDNLIFDHHDDATLGYFFYEPFKVKPDTVNPISPPSRVKKQLVAGEVHLSWDGNPEEDLSGYKVYSGQFRHYAFDEVMDAGNVNSLSLPGVLITDSIAVTAYDSGYQYQEAQVRGFESPFAFASYYPFAGFDGQFCVNQAQYILTEGSVPFLYDLISWKTTGDGLFNDPSLINPVYVPGIQDRQTGSVVLSLNVLRQGEWLSDSLTLHIFDDPTVYAGADTTLFADQELLINNANESNAAELLWISTGDGFFTSDTSLITTYLPGTNDVTAGQVELILYGSNVCDQSSDTLFVKLVSRFSLNGTVWMGNQKAEFSSILAVDRLLPHDRAVTLTTTNVDGNFQFNTLFPSSYILYAVPDTNHSGDYFPGYYAEAVRWHNAYAVKLDADIYDVDIRLPGTNFPPVTGSGKISGRFELSKSNSLMSDVYCMSWFDDDTIIEYCNGGESNVTILLYNSTNEKVLGYTLTDAEGKFYFNNLPYGHYLLNAEKAGFLTHGSPLISLTTEQPVVDDVVLTSDRKTISIELKNQQSGSDLTLFEVFPNPASETINIGAGVKLKGQYQLHIVNLYGITVSTKIWQITNPEIFQQAVLAIEHLRPGFYQLILSGPNTFHTQSLVIY